MAKAIGIDLGTSNSAAAYMEGGKPKMIPSAEGTTLVGGKAFPSYVALTESGELLVGEPARRQTVANPRRTVTGAKRKMGTDFKYKIGDKQYTPQQISAFILQKIKKDAEDYLGDKVTEAVITVPAYFNDAQRQATKDAAAIADLKVLRLINEPTAASLAYGLDKVKTEEGCQILVFDFGAGTLDVTLMEIAQVEGEKKKKESQFEVLSTSGDTSLGGRDMDEKLIGYIIDQFKQDQGADVSKDEMAMQRVREAAEKAKIELSSTKQTEINLPYITATPEGPKHLTMKINRAKLEELVKPVVDKCRGPVKQALADAKLKPAEVEKVILVGGPTRMPIVQQFIKDIFGDKIERGIDPTNCVADGAAIQAGILSGEADSKDVLLLDVTPLTLGIETLGGVMTPLIERNTTIPASKTKTFSTAADSQSSVEIHVLQGERPMVADNRTLGRFILSGIPPAPRGIPQIDVTFDLDANGILNVSARDKGTGKEKSITIKESSALSETEIEKMKQEAERFAQEDQKKKELIDLSNQAETLIYSSQKVLEEQGDKVKEEDKKEIKEKISQLEKAQQEKNIERMKQLIKELSNAVQKIGAQIYQQQQKTGSQPQKGAEKQAKEKDKGKKKDQSDPIEGEFEESE